MNFVIEPIEVSCQKCGRAIHIEAGDDFSREIAHRLGKLIVCDACTAPILDPENLPHYPQAG